MNGKRGSTDLLRLLLQLPDLRTLRVQRHLHLVETKSNKTQRAKRMITRNISLFLAINSLVFSLSRRTGGSVVCEAAASLLRTGALTSARESIDFTNSADM